MSFLRDAFKRIAANAIDGIVKEGEDVLKAGKRKLEETLDEIDKTRDEFREMAGQLDCKGCGTRPGEKHKDFCNRVRSNANGS